MSRLHVNRRWIACRIWDFRRRSIKLWLTKNIVSSIYRCAFERETRIFPQKSHIFNREKKINFPMTSENGGTWVASDLFSEFCQCWNYQFLANVLFFCIFICLTWTLLITRNYIITRYLLMEEDGWGEASIMMNLWMEIVEFVTYFYQFSLLLRMDISIFSIWKFTVKILCIRCGALS